MTRLAAFSVVVVVLIGVLLPAPRTASAHATLVSSEPAANDFLRRPPDAIVLNFSEPLARSSSGLRLLDANGLAIETGPIAFTSNSLGMRATVPRLSPGIYNVVWENVSTVDGHGLRGSFPFTVLNPDGSIPDAVNTVGQVGGSSDPVPLADAAAVRWLSLTGLLIATGGALVLLLSTHAEPSQVRGLRTMIVLGAGVALLAALLNVAVISREYASIGLAEILLQSRIGGYWLVRLGGAFFILMAAAFVIEAPRRAALGVAAGVAVSLWGFSATSHAAAGAGSAWAIAIDFAHAAAAISWIGAVIGLAVAVRLGWKGVQQATLLPRVSLLASLMVFVVLATGLLSSLIQVDSSSALGDTRYGVTLLLKLGLMVVLLLVALLNARRARRWLQSGGLDQRRRFLKVASAEVAFGLGVFLLAAILTQTTSAKSVIREPDAPPYSETVAAGDLAVALDIEPNRTGVNTFHVSVTNPAGDPLKADLVRLTFRYQQDQTVGPSTLDLDPSPEPGVFEGQGPFLPLEGQWRVEALLRAPDMDDTVAFFDVRPAGPAVVTWHTGSRWSNPSPGLTWNEFGGLIVLMAGLGFALFRGRLNLLGRWPGAGANAATVAGFGLGTLLMFGVHTHDTGDIPNNPIYPDRESIARGRLLYQQNCQSCHGATGIPPIGLDLSPYPLDLTVHVPQHADGEVFTFIKNGVPGTAMIAWGDEGGLTDDEIWHLVNYLRTLHTVEE